jgi:hypothetical protein
MTSATDPAATSPDAGSPSPPWPKSDCTPAPAAAVIVYNDVDKGGEKDSISMHVQEKAGADTKDRKRNN